jgi:hypothetical protein
MIICDFLENLLCESVKFDEINGLKWEEKIKQQREREEDISRLIFKKIILKNFLLKQPLVAIKNSVKGVFYKKYPSYSHFY